jgi:hypothetical protein
MLMDLDGLSKGVTGGLGLVGGIVLGLSGMWKYLVCLGRSMVGMGAILRVQLGG